MISARQVQRVWDRTQKIRGKDSDLYRKDPYNNTIYFHSYGKSSPMGWEIDHIKPRSRGGSDSTVNLQCLKTSVNRAKSNSLVKKSRHNCNSAKFVNFWSW